KRLHNLPPRGTLVPQPFSPVLISCVLGCEGKVTVHVCAIECIGQTRAGPRGGVLKLRLRVQFLQTRERRVEVCIIKPIAAASSIVFDNQETTSPPLLVVALIRGASLGMSDG